MKRILDMLGAPPNKRAMSEALVCPITRNLMVEPVVAADGHTYERSAILQWIHIRQTSPLNPSLLLNAANLVPNRHLETIIEEAIKQGDVEPADVDDWKKRRTGSRNARELYHAGQIMEAAALGFPLAQGKLAQKAFDARDYVTAMHWAKLAADSFEPVGTFYLAFAFMTGRGQPMDWEKAFTYFARIHETIPCTKYICQMYEEGGHGLEKSDREYFLWLKRGQFEHPENGWKLGLCYYEGVGVELNHVNARKVWSLCTHPEARFRHGKMVIKGEGGSVDRTLGIQSIEQAATLGCANALTFLRTLSEL